MARMILLIDDDAALLRATRRMFETRDYRVAAYAESTDALECLLKQEDKFDLIISDYNLPELNGIELLRELRKAGLDTPFILYTGEDNSLLQEECQKLGAHFLLKPGTLLAKVAELLDKK